MTMIIIISPVMPSLRQIYLSDNIVEGSGYKKAGADKQF